MHSPGRPRILDETKRTEICTLVAEGFTPQQIATRIGCAVRTIRRESQRNPDFSQQLEAVRDSVAADPLQSVRHAASGNWRAAAWLLERTDPDRFAGFAGSGPTAEQVEDLVLRIMETALESFPRDHHTQLALYLRLNRVAQDCLSMLFPNRKRYKSRMQTPLVDEQRELADIGFARLDSHERPPLVKAAPKPSKSTRNAADPKKTARLPKPVKLTADQLDKLDDEQKRVRLMKKPPWGWEAWWRRYREP